ncbi:MAG TPA: RagB/SusD family nutrient uptake outer membrane protein [Gemmatimonadales bacterium]|nr:RagB/SusD family nutrient uptake outer membrane protein [Gemmatimonadales bacterium]
MNKRQLALLVGVVSIAGGCHDFLDVNNNPNGPQSVTANLYLPPMLHWLVTSPQFDGRFVGHYAQEWISTSANFSPAQSWGRMGYDAASDNGGQQWRDVYWSLGQNLVDMNAKATAEQRWDLLGVGLTLKAWGWQVLTDLHGEIIIKEAFDQSRTTFDYDTQDYAYQEVQRLLDSAIVLLRRTDGAVDASYLAKGDHIYNGNRVQWLRFAWGLKALVLNHFSNKSSYQPDSVIAAVDSSFRSNGDDALLAYPATSTDLQDYNFWGRTRNNATLYRQTLFTLNLMNGTQFGGVVDPRMTRMLSPSPDGQYRGLDPNVLGFGALTTAQQPQNFFGYPGTGGLGLPARYIFADRSKIPVMTYAELQFIKAEAALRKGDQATARTAYINGISASIDFVNARNLDAGQTPTQITGTEKTTFLADTNIVPAIVTRSHVMSQKFIALWGWGHNEIWMDMRRYHYTDLDPVSGVEVFRGFAPPTNLFPDNQNKVVQRIRPRYNSEYVWNQAGLAAIGALASDYHTDTLWITKP